MELPQDTDEFIGYIRQTIKDHRINMRVLEREAGVPKDTVRSIIRGLSKNPRLGTISKILSAIRRIQEGKTTEKIVRSPENIDARISSLETAIGELTDNIGKLSEQFKTIIKSQDGQA